MSILQAAQLRARDLIVSACFSLIASNALGSPQVASLEIFPSCYEEQGNNKRFIYYGWRNSTASTFHIPRANGKNFFIPNALSWAPVSTYFPANSEDRYAFAVPNVDLNCNAQWIINTQGLNLRADPTPLCKSIPLCSFVLPVTFGGVSAHYVGESLRVTWMTLSEKNNAYFTVEASLDNMQFSALKTTTGSGDSVARREYSEQIGSVDRWAYVRIRQTDYDGKTETSPTVAIKLALSTLNDYRIYPNPIVSGDLLNFRDIPAGSSLRIIDTRGNTVFVQNITATDGSLNPRLKPGIYTVVIENTSGVSQKRIVVN